jgi:PAS domain S-box-containing protein
MVREDADDRGRPAVAVVGEGDAVETVRERLRGTGTVVQSGADHADHADVVFCAPERVASTADTVDVPVVAVVDSAPANRPRETTPGSMPDDHVPNGSAAASEDGKPDEDADRLAIERAALRDGACDVYRAGSDPAPPRLASWLAGPRFADPRSGSLGDARSASRVDVADGTHRPGEDARESPAGEASARGAADVAAGLATLGDGFVVLDRRWRLRSSGGDGSTLLGVGSPGTGGDRSTALAASQEGTTGTGSKADRPRGVDLSGEDPARGGATEAASIWRRRPELVGTGLRTACWNAVVDRADGVTPEASRTGATPRTVAFGIDDRQLEATVVAAADGVVVRLRDVTESTAVRREHDEYERILSTIEDGVYVLDENFRIVRINEAVSEMLGYRREELVGSHATMLADQSVIAEAAETIGEILRSERETGRLDADLRTKRGEPLPVETRFSALTFGDDSYGSVGVIRDITDRRRYERTLETLYRSTRDLFASDTRREVADLVVDTAAEVLDLRTVVVYLFDEVDGRLVAAASGAGDRSDRALPREGPLWESYVDGELRTIPVPAALPESSDVVGSAEADEVETGTSKADEVETGTGFDDTNGTSERSADGGDEDPAVAVPLGEHGLLVAAAPTGDEGTTARGWQTLTNLLAANAEAAFDRLERTMELAHREQLVARRNEELTRLNEFNRLIRDVNRALVEADTREGIERAVCDRLAASSMLTFAWIGEYDPADGTLEPRAWAGAERGYLDEMAAAADRDEPARRAARLGEVVVVDDIAHGVQESEWRGRAVSREFRSVAAIPLVYEGYVYGALAAYAGGTAAFDDVTRQTLAELGVTTANAINSAQAKASLASDAAVGLDLRVEAPNGPLARIAAALDASVELDGSVPRPNDRTLLYLSVRRDDVDRRRGDADDAGAVTNGGSDGSEVGGDDATGARTDGDALDTDALASAVEARVTGVAAVERAAVVAERERGLSLEVETAGPSVPGRLASYGATVRSATADSTGVDASVALPQTASVREFVETVADAYAGTELIARRPGGETARERADVEAALTTDLTDRQREALRTAYHAGYFEWPRDRDAREVAESLGVTQPTFSRHLRVAERKLLDRLLDGDV